MTGGTGGVGRATVQAFAAAGCDVAALARGQAGLDGAVKDVEAVGGRGLGITTDVADYDAVRRGARQVEAELGEIDVWVNVASSGSLAYLAGYPRRNMWVGISTAYTILGERVAPKLLDLYLGRTGIKSQQNSKDLPRGARTCSSLRTRTPTGCPRRLRR